MLSKIGTDEEKLKYIEKLKEIDEIFVKQQNLPKDARISKSILEKLENLYRGLEKEIIKYDKIKKII